MLRLTPVVSDRQRPCATALLTSCQCKGRSYCARTSSVGWSPLLWRSVGVELLSSVAAAFAAPLRPCVAPLPWPPPPLPLWLTPLPASWPLLLGLTCGDAEARDQQCKHMYREVCGSECLECIGRREARSQASYACAKPQMSTSCFSHVSGPPGQKGIWHLLWPHLPVGAA